MDLPFNFHSLFHALFINFGMFAGLFTILTLSPNFIKLTDTNKQKMVIGLIFGMAAALSILFSIEIMPGIIIDCRVTILTMTGFFFGPIAAAIAIIPAAIIRFFMGGHVELGILVIVLSAGIGVLCQYIITQRIRSSINIKHILVISAILAALIPLISTPFFDMAYLHALLTVLIPAYVTQSFLSTLILGVLLLTAYKNLYLEDELGRIHIKANRIRSAKTEFLAMMSHEIRTPMNGVLGFTEILGQTDLDDYQNHCLTQIKTAGTTMMRLLDDILDFSRIDSGKFSLSNTPIDLISNIRATMDLLEAEGNANNNKMSLSIAPDVPQYIYGDTHRIRQVLYNLLANAAKFTENGKIELIVGAEKSSKDSASALSPSPKEKTLLNKTIKRIDDADGLLNIFVKDSGIGIPLEKQQSIFSAFEQESASTSGKFGGSGLGLAIVKKLVKLMGGTISLESYIGKGTTFNIRLPYIIPTQNEIDAKPSTSTDKPITVGHIYGDQDNKEDGEAEVIIGDNRFVLLVEDIEMNQELAASMLMQNGFQVHVVSNGLEAIEAVKKNGPFHLVFMDIRMPKMDGIEATKHIRKELKMSHEDLPIVALTAHVLGAEIKDCLKAGMDDYVSKPINAEILIKKAGQWAKPSGIDSFDALLNDDEDSFSHIIESSISGDNPYMDTSSDHYDNDDSDDEDYDDPFVTNTLAGKTVENSPLIDEDMITQFMDFMGKEKIISVFEVFETDIAQRFKDIKHNKFELSTIQKETHAMSSTAGNLGMTKFSVSCREIMDMPDDLKQEPEKLRAQIAALQELAEESCKAFSAYLA